MILNFNYDVDPPFGAQETLRSWQKKNHPWLELSDVHKETTENIRVTVIPFYMGYRESQTNSVYWVRNYSILPLQYFNNCKLINFCLVEILYTTRKFR